jgi:hypothetical protein
MLFATNHRFSITAFAMAATMSLALNGIMLKGFDQLASVGEQGRTEAAHLAKAQATTPTLTLERVTISARRA